MALNEHIEILRQGPDFWNRWRRDNPDVIPDLRQAVLRGALLRGIHFKDANLEGASLEGADLQTADPLDEKTWAAPYGGGGGFQQPGVAMPFAGGFSGGQLLDSFLGGANPLRRRPKPERRRESRSQVWGAELWASNLEAANLRGADLRKGNFRGANLRDANLRGANLEGADLRDVNLWGANLGAARLVDVDLRYAKIGMTIWNGVDLARIRGLGTMEHLGPSSIGIDTLEATARSLRQDPSGRDEIEAFLLRAGVRSDHLEIFRRALGEGLGLRRCFISYSQADSAFARWLYDRLHSRGVGCWLHPHEKLQDDDDHGMIADSRDLWDVVLLCCSKTSMTSWWIEGEIERARENETRLGRRERHPVVSLVGLNLDGHLFSSSRGSGVEAEVKERLVADFSGWEKKNANLDLPLEQVLEALRFEAAVMT